MAEPVGCPTKFTDETKEKLIYAVGKGAPYCLACDYAGIDYSTFKLWRREARAGDQDKLSFFSAIKEAKGDSVVGWLEKIDKAAAEGTWTAAAWKLERRYYKYFGKSADVMELAKNMDRIEKEIKRANRQNQSESNDDKEITE